MRYKPYYSNILIISSIFYYITAMLDFSITMGAYNYYGDLFFLMELNPAICFVLRSGMPPIYMFILPLVVIILSTYFKKLANKLHKESMISDRSMWGLGFAVCLIIMMGILHLIGFISWFYHGAF